MLASGCSGALELVIRSLAGPGDNILLPRPGFCLYRCLAEPLGVDCRDYDLLVSDSVGSVVCLMYWIYGCNFSISHRNSGR